MKKIIILILAILGIGTFTACKKWLDVKPEDKFLEKDLFSTKQGFEDVMNGVYISIANNNMYGARLTSTTLDAMAQLYKVDNGNASYEMANYTYGEIKSRAIIEEIWGDLYIGITNANKFLENIDAYGSVLSTNEKAVYKGETHGLRAMYYFDLLRLFTPTYNTPDSVNKVLPYYDKTGFAISDFKPSNFIMEKILEDLNMAETLMANTDPAVAATRITKVTSARDGRASRNYRLNYYAIKALKARVYLWRGDKVSALKEAKFVIDNQSKYPWITASDLSISAIANKIFGTEMLFGIENLRLETLFTDNFSPAISDATFLAPETSGNFVKTTVFEDKEDDFRYAQWFRTEGKPFPTFFKYQRIGGTPYLSSSYTVPLIKASEVYLIAAECETDPNNALAYLNVLRNNRNRLSISVFSTAELMKEYRREFYGEGQLFYYYKRNATTSIISGGTNAAKTISLSNYTLPIPLSETAPR